MSHEQDIGDVDNRSQGSDIIATTRRSSSTTHHDIPSTLEEIESEDDNEIELELTIEYMTNGQDDMKEENYTTAEENFRAALELAEEYDFSRKLDYGPGDITLVLADCLMRQDREEEALELLEPIADGSSKSHLNGPDGLRRSSRSDTTRDQITQYKACHVLGTVFMKRSDYNSAEKRAQEAFRGRRKACGAQDPTTLESVQLLIDIYTAKDDTQKARAHRRFLEPKPKGRALTSNEGSTPVTTISSSPPEVTKPAAMATTNSSVPAALDESDSLIPAALQPKKSPEVSPQPTSVTTPPVLSNGFSSLNNSLPPIVEDERLSIVLEVEPAQVQSPLEEPGSQIPDYMRRAVQSASASSSLPLPPPEVPTRSEARNPRTASPNQSASQAALASIFASSGPKPAKPMRENSVGEPTTIPPQTHPTGVAAATSNLATKSVRENVESRQLQAPPKISVSPSLATPSASVQSTTNPTSYVPEQHQKEFAPPLPSKTFSWALENEISVPSSIAKVVSPQPTAIASTNTSSTSVVQPDPLPANVGSSTATKKKGWSISFSRSKTDGYPKKSTTMANSVPMAGSAATSFSPSRSTSITTMESVVEPKRQMSLAGSVSSQSTSLLEKELFYVDEKSPRASVASRSYSTSTHPPARTYQELAPSTLR